MTGKDNRQIFLTDLEQALSFTSVHRHSADLPVMEREILCLSEMLPHLLQPLRPDDGFAGHARPGLVGFSPEPGGFGYYCREADIRTCLSHLTHSSGSGQMEGVDQAGSDNRNDPLMQRVQDMLVYWKTEQTSAKVRAAYPTHVAEALPTDEWTTESGVAFPLYRLAGTHPDYGRLVRRGITGLRQDVMARLATSDDEEVQRFLHGLLASLSLLADICRRYEEEATALADASDQHPETRIRAKEIALSLHRLAQEKPATLRDAIQLIWLYSLASGSWNYGRLDVTLGDFLQEDLRCGRLTEATAQVLINDFWRLLSERNSIWNGRIILGGKGRINPASADAFAHLAMEATRTVPGSDPQLTLRWHDGLSPDLLRQALSILGEGRTFPLLYNDDVNIPAVAQAFRIPEHEAVCYVPYGCGEYVIEHASIGTPSGVINLLKAVEITLRDGRDPLTGMQVGPKTGTLDSFRTFDQFFDAYARQVSFQIAILAEQEKIEYEVAAATAPFLLLSLLFDDCIEKARPLLSGGVRYLGGTIETYGNTNAANSLLAVKRLLFPDRDSHAGSTAGLRHPITPAQLLDALDADFIGHEALHAHLLSLPKYGNDQEEADLMAIRVHEQVCQTARIEADRVGLHSYLVVLINNSANTTLGIKTAASPDGRKSGEPMANANNPWNGTDRNGLTAMLRSLACLDPSLHAGAVQNLTLSPDLFRNGAELAWQVVTSWFRIGGSQLMLNVFNKEDLVQAIKTPERYGNLFVRVGGFSARFVGLDPGVQQEILSRTLYR